MAETYEESQARLTKAFLLVKPQPNWKMPIDAVIDAKDMAAVTEAVIHFTGSVPEYVMVKGQPDQRRCLAAGYYETIGA